MEIGSVVLQVHVGDLCEKTTDAIINSTNKQLDLRIGEVWLRTLEGIVVDGGIWIDRWMDGWIETLFMHVFGCNFCRRKVDGYLL